MTLGVFFSLSDRARREVLGHAAGREGGEHQHDEVAGYRGGHARNGGLRDRHGVCARWRGRPTIGLARASSSMPRGLAPRHYLKKYDTPTTPLLELIPTLGLLV
jgi:hypothetical protein